MPGAAGPRIFLGVTLTPNLLRLNEMQSIYQTETTTTRTLKLNLFDTNWCHFYVASMH